MDENESVPENPSEGLAQASGDTISSEKPSDAEPTPDKANEAPETIEDIASEVKKGSEVNSVDSEPDNSELQNHVEHDTSVDSENAKESEEQTNDKEDEDERPTTDAEEKNESESNEIEKDEQETEASQAEEEETEKLDETNDKLKEELTGEDSQDASQSESQSQEVENQSVDTENQSQSEKADETEKEKNDDEVGKPEFEHANDAMEESQEDHSQALDPFDALLKDNNDTTATDAEAATSQADTSINLDEDDDHNAEFDGDNAADDVSPTLLKIMARAKTQSYAQDPIISCFIGTCKNKVITTPEKMFFRIPSTNQDEWCIAVKRKVVKGALYICQDHLNLEEDLVNFDNWLNKGIKPRLRPQAVERLKKTLIIADPEPSSSSKKPQKFTKTKLVNPWRLQIERHRVIEGLFPVEMSTDENEPALDDSGVTELGEGADEEVCLLPDTEREISEADKAEAEKVLAEKRKQAEAEAALAAIPKEENEAMETDDQDARSQPDADDGDAATEDASQENGAENDKEHEDAETETLEHDGTPNTIQEISHFDATCVECSEEKPCSFRYATKDGERHYLCNGDCVRAFVEKQPGQYNIAHKKYMIEEIIPAVSECSECEEKKMCYFYYNYDGEDTNYCSIACLESMMGDEKEKYIFKRKRISVEEVERDGECSVCQLNKKCTYSCTRYGEELLICDQMCVKTLNTKENGRYMIKRKRVPRNSQTQPQTNAQVNPPLLRLKVISNATDKYLDEAYKIQAKTPAMVAAAREERERTFMRKCTQCNLILASEDKLLSWETMDFCDEVCLGRYQNKIGSKCANCKNPVQHTSLGKYCVRFGYDIRQFCNSGCLEEFKKGLKICCYCQRDISVGHEGFLAPVGDKGQFKDFCSQNCMEKFDHMSKNPVPQPVWAKCAVCSLEKATTIEVEAGNDVQQRLCSDPCFAAFKFVNNIFPDQCRWCKKYFERKQTKCFTIYESSTPHCFCSKACMNVYISNSRHIVPCNWCKVKKYNFDLIRRLQPNGQAVMMCSLNCLNLYQVSVNAVSSRKTKCDYCKRTSLAQYHLTMSDATVRNFCTYQCVMAFQRQYSKPAAPAFLPGEAVEPQKAVPTGAPRRTYASGKNNASKGSQRNSTGSMPVISNVQSLAAPPPLMPTVQVTRAKSKRHAAAVQAAAPPPPEPEPPAAPKTPPPPPKPPTPPPPPPPKIYNHVIVKTLPPQEVANKGTMSKPMMVSKGVSCRPHPCTKECQTDPSLERRVLIPIPVPIYVPVPCAMWSLPFPVPVPIPIPIPTPVFIPTTRNSAKGIMKEINKIHDKMPTDPFEAELLMMAEMVAGDKKKDQSDSDTDDDNEESFSPVAGMDGNNAFGEDMLQMALKMATEYEDQPVDLESAMTANTITPSSHPGMPGLEGENMHHHHMMVLEQQRAVAALRASSAAAAPRKRAAAAPARPARSKRRRAEPAPTPQPEPPREPAEKPDANMCLKYTFGVNAWKQWVMTKNAEIEKSSIRRKPFKSEILQLTADELNYSLCLFVKEVRKPNGSEYAPDTIYYLVLGIQQYLFENGRIDNIFTDPYYEKFTDCLDEVARKFSVLYNDSQYIVTRVEEEHLWESKQLGAHSPHVLLSTLMFFNTKHFNLVTVEEHMQLSFSHIMKHWKRNPNQPGQAKIPGSRNVLLRFYPPQSALEANSRKKKVYEQQENEENPLRCPVKLYEFYISKCPESVRTRNDVFYLQPERSCVPDSPVWYSTQPLSRSALAKMLHRVKMVKEINIALLTS